VHVNGCAARDSNPEPADQEFERSTFTGFTGIRAAAQTVRAYSSELSRTPVNCNPR
jgi:hypothetical protein